MKEEFQAGDTIDALARYYSDQANAGAFMTDLRKWGVTLDEYKSFITFFPFLPEAAYAQMQIAMVHYRRMDRSDRDHTEAQLAEQEFQTFLQKYPDSPLVDGSKQHLREIQEALADSDFRISEFYYTRKSYRAAASRLAELVDRYPLYSKSDQALFMLGSLKHVAVMSVPGSVARTAEVLYDPYSAE